MTSYAQAVKEAHAPQQVRIIQVKTTKDGTDRYPWPTPATSIAGARGQIQRWLEKVAQHWHQEQTPRFAWHGKISNELTFGAGEEAVTYRFELEEPR